MSEFEGLSVSYPTDRSLQRRFAEDHGRRRVIFQYPTLRIVLCNVSTMCKN